MKNMDKKKDIYFKCEWHKSKSDKMGYIEYFDWSEKQQKKGKPLYDVFSNNKILHFHSKNV